MKKTLTIVTLIIVVLIAAAAIFALTFDANRYKGVIAQKAGDAMRKDVALDKISLSFSHGLGCRIEGLAIKEKNAGWDKAWLRAKRLDVSVQILPLLKKDIQLDRVDIDGLDVKLDNNILKQPVEQALPSGEKIDTGKAALGALKFLAKAITVTDSMISYTSENSITALRLGITSLSLTNVSASGPMRFNAVFSTLDKGKDNIAIKGIAFPDLSGKSPYIKNLELKADLGKIDLAAALEAAGFEKYASQLDGKDVAGVLTLRAEKLYADPAKMWDSVIAISLGNFSVGLKSAPGIIKDVNLESRLDKGDLVIKKLNGTLAGGPISASGAIKNIAELVSGKAAPKAENVFAQFNIQDFNIPELANFFGKQDIAGVLEGKTLKGSVTIQSEKISLDKKEGSGGISFLISQAETDMIPVKGGVKDVGLDAVLERNDLNVRKLSGSIAGGTFLAGGRVRDIFSSQDAEFDISASGVDMDSLVPQTAQGAPRFNGIADLKAMVTWSGLSQDQIMKSLAGTGSLKIEKPLLKDMNVLRLAFEKMDMIPGLINNLVQNLPDNYIEVLKQKDTNFKPMSSDFTISQGKIIFKEANVKSDGFLVRGSGDVSFQGDVNIGSYLFIAPDLSQAFVKAVKELGYLANEQGMINMPLAVSGRAPNLAVGIDRDYVLKKLLVSKGAEILEGIFRKKDSSQTGAQEDQTGAQAQPDGSRQDIQSQDQQQKGSSGDGDTGSLLDSVFGVFK